MKEHLWVEHLTGLPKRGVGTLSSISAQKCAHLRPIQVYSSSIPKIAQLQWYPVYNT